MEFLARWVAATMLAGLLGVTALEFSSCTAGEPYSSAPAASSVAPERRGETAKAELPVGIEIEQTEWRAMPVLTQ